MRILRGRSEREDTEGGNSRKEERKMQDLTVESAAEMIDSLPSDVPKESQLLIVQEAFAAAGIDLSYLERHARTREDQLSSEIGLVRNRQEALREKAEDTVHALEEQIRNMQEKIREVRETFDAALTEEEEKLSTPSAALKEVRRVRAFFAFPEANDTPGTDREENPTPSKHRVQAKGYGVKGEGFRQTRF
jgi:hypothetical protein